MPTLYLSQQPSTRRLFAAARPPKALQNHPRGNNHFPSGPSLGLALNLPLLSLKHYTVTHSLYTKTEPISLLCDHDTRFPRVVQKKQNPN